MKQFKVGQEIWFVHGIAATSVTGPHLVIGVDGDRVFVAHGIPAYHSRCYSLEEAHAENVKRHRDAYNKAVLAMAEAFPTIHRHGPIILTGGKTWFCERFFDGNWYGVSGDVKYDTAAEAIRAALGVSE